MRKAEQTRWPLAPEYASITDAGNQTGSAWYQGKSAPLADPLAKTVGPATRAASDHRQHPGTLDNIKAAMHGEAFAYAKYTAYAVQAART